ncbi:hypothetical protein PGT21_016082 [Puccinia graminis f. sp. tritici]|uniref:Uncharacterized protein n=1 Tax=Puccinia graminis f. sp. tritici TaxID=56615 RepID=A0A5B0MDE1_PUCGR|nr:hypothetical protein PGT21_016082 [Puccinia graminis f. sp. tritici]
MSYCAGGRAFGGSLRDRPPSNRHEGLTAHPCRLPTGYSIALVHRVRRLYKLVRTRKQRSIGFKRCATAGDRSIAQLLSSASSVPNPTRAASYLKRCSQTTDPNRVIPSGINTRKRITSQEGPQRCHSEQPLRSVASASLMLFRAVVEECPLGLSDADLNGHRGDCTLNDGRSERPSSTRGLGAGTLYAGAVPGYRRISAHKQHRASGILMCEFGRADYVILSQRGEGRRGSSQMTLYSLRTRCTRAIE